MADRNHTGFTSIPATGRDQSPLGRLRAAVERVRALPWRHLFAMGGGAACVMVAAMGVAFVALYLWYASDLRPAGGAQIFDRNGQLLYQYVDSRSGLRSPVKLEDISPYMIAATISTEDASFWTNPGINAKGVARAGLEYLHLKSADASQTTGGSSITQQLARNVYISPNQRYNRTLMRKFQETAYAVALTDKYSKNQILEWYLNQISYGGLYNGVEAAAEGYFGKHAKDLSLAESAMHKSAEESEVTAIPGGPLVPAPPAPLPAPTHGD